jgi:deoxycytidine triphosphate deaminase
MKSLLLVVPGMPRYCFTLTEHSTLNNTQHSAHRSQHILIVLSLYLWLCSVDLTLSNEFRFFKPGHHVIDVREEIDFKDITEHVTLKDGESWLLLPGTACLGITEERIKLAPHLCGLLGVLPRDYRVAVASSA